MNQHEYAGPEQVYPVVINYVGLCVAGPSTSSCQYLIGIQLQMRGEEPINIGLRYEQALELRNLISEQLASLRRMNNSGIDASLWMQLPPGE